jgi:hypothetical protein
MDPQWLARRMLAAIAATMVAVFLAGAFVAFLIGGSR